MVALCGLGGAGKTSLALEYAHRHLAEVGLAWQFPAGDQSVLMAEFGELAAQLDSRDLLDPRNPVVSVHAVLAAYQAPWLLIFDNAPDPMSVAPFVPPAGQGRVLITSRNQIWPLSQALDVPVLDANTAADFLINRTGDPDRSSAMELALELGGLPLALEQAAAYIQATGDNLAEYRASFQQRRPDMLARGDPIGYGQTVAATWMLAFSRLEKSAPQAASLLRLLAFCASESIPLRLLLQPSRYSIEEIDPQVAEVLWPLLEDELQTKDAIAALRRYSLITPGRDGSVSVHRLVQAFTIDYMPKEMADAWRDATADLVDEAIPIDPQDPQTWTDYAALLPHAQAVLVPAEHYGLSRLVHYLGASANYIAARDLQQKIFDATKERYGPDDRDTLIAQGSLAVAVAREGNLAESQNLLAALLPVIERAFGPENPHPLQTRANLAYVTGQAGDPAGARDQYAALVPIRERVSGPEHPDTLMAKGNLARFTGKAGDPDEARNQLTELVPIFRRALGPEAPGTLTAESLLADFTGEAGDAAGARDQHAALVPIRERVIGREHPDTLTTQAKLARWTGEAGDAAGARDQYAALLPVLERVKGPEHPETVSMRANLVRWTGEARDAAAARE